MSDTDGSLVNISKNAHSSVAAALPNLDLNPSNLSSAGKEINLGLGVFSIQCEGDHSSIQSGLNLTAPINSTGMFGWAKAH